MYYHPEPVSESELALMRRIDELHLEHPFAGSRMLRDFLRLQGIEVGRRHMGTLMRRMGIQALHRKPNTSRRQPAHPVAVFADPNCGYCKRFEKDTVNLKNVTVYTFLYPILGADSPQKSRDVWCAKDPTKAWREWMIEGKSVPRTMGQCDDSALPRVMALGRKLRITGTPTLIFENGKRVPGALPAEEVEKHLAAVPGKR